MMNARHELKREAETIMLAGGFAEARAEHFGPWWRVYGLLPKQRGQVEGNEHVGTTHLQADPQDPREMARTLVARAKAEQITDEPAAPETVEDTFPQGEGPFDPQPEASETPQHETHGETGEAATDGADQRHPEADPAHVEGGGGAALAVELDGDATGGDALRDDHELAGGDQGSDAGRDDLPVVSEPIPDLPEIELIPPDPDPDFGAEFLEYEGELSEPKEEAPSGAFIFGDNLDQKRTAAIGLVVQIALQKMPDWPPELDARLGELRNFAAGVGEGRFTNNDELQAELKAIEARLSLRRSIEEVRDKKVGALVAANREQIEAFDPEAGWP